MKKAEEKKLREQLLELIGDDYKSVDLLMVNDLLDWLSIAQAVKKEIQESVKSGDNIGWQEMTKLSMCTKNCIALCKSLKISVYERSKGKKESNQGFDLNKFLNEN